MALQGKMILNGADYAPFDLYGVGVFMAHSGLGANRNNASCKHVANTGPIPPGKYWIVDRREGNWFSQKKRRFTMKLTDLLAEMLLVNLTGSLCGVMTGVLMTTPG